MMTYVVCCMLTGVAELEIRLIDGDLCCMLYVDRGVRAGDSPCGR